MDVDVKTFDRDGAVFSNRGYKTRKEDFVQIDLSGVRLLHAGIDTFKQLFVGLINDDILKIVELHYDAHCDFPIVFGDYEFKVSKAGSKSGFQWVLRNYDLGLVLMFKSFYAESGEVGTHLKIEYSPHVLLNRDVCEIDRMSLDIGAIFFLEFQCSDVSVHLACDVKGWSIPHDMDKRLRTRAKRSFAFHGVSEFETDLNAVAVRYGTAESFTFGRAGALQLCVYDKTKEIQHKDKVHFWADRWRLTPSVEDCFVPEFQDGDQVTRIEFRFHHSVIRQFCQGTNGMECQNLSELSPHLTALFQYALNNFRLHYSKNFIDPFWQMLLEDVEILRPSNPLIYQRDYGNKSDSGSSRRNVAFWIGNALRLFSRQQFTVEYVTKYLMESGLIRDLKAYCKMEPQSTDDELYMVLHDFVRKRMNDHFMNGVHI